MNTGKTLFAQIMDFLPWSTFDRILPGEFGSANRSAISDRSFVVGLPASNAARTD
jgi:hypothetical protein